jgi:hypothetical protein
MLRKIIHFTSLQFAFTSLSCTVKANIDFSFLKFRRYTQAVYTGGLQCDLLPTRNEKRCGHS